MTNQPDVGLDWARHAIAFDAARLPEPVAHITKLSILDTLGVMLAATAFSESILRPVVGFVQDSAGRPQSSVAVFGPKVPTAMAAFANGAMAHCLDYDDLTHDIALHPSSSTVPIALAMAERVSSAAGEPGGTGEPLASGPVPGRELLAAVAIGNDLSTRLGDSIVWKSDWFTTPLFGFFSATLTAARIAGLDVDRAFNAVGIAFCQAAGTLEMRRSTGSDIAGIYGAWPNHGAAVAVELAARGVPGIARAFEGETGLYQVYFGGEYDRSQLVDGLGEDFRGDRVSFKPWPACGITHNPIQAVIDLVVDHDLSPDDLAEIRVLTGNENCWALCEPLDVRRRPPTAMDARYSIPYTVAAAAVTRDVRLGDFTADALRRPDVAAVADRVVPVFDPELRRSEPIPPATVQIDTTDGRTLRTTVEVSYGRAPDRPMTEADVVAKFRDCASFAAVPFPDARVDEIVDAVLGLEDLPDAGVLAPLLVP
ncbi:MAG TPA: MmgE/PrpD family protein [Acidimicrobiales bacterium]